MHAFYSAGDTAHVRISIDSEDFLSKPLPWQVRGKLPADQYIVFPEHYCSCKAFQFDVVGKSDAAYVRCYCAILHERRRTADLCLSHATCFSFESCIVLLVQCKHQLAARIGDILGKCSYTEIADHVLSNMLMAA